MRLDSKRNEIQKIEKYRRKLQTGGGTVKSIIADTIGLLLLTHQDCQAYSSNYIKDTDRKYCHPHSSILTKKVSRS